jgi:hypothetical protein
MAQMGFKLTIGGEIAIGMPMQQRGDNLHFPPRINKGTRAAPSGGPPSIPDPGAKL